MSAAGPNDPLGVAREASDARADFILAQDARVRALEGRVQALVAERAALRRALRRPAADDLVPLACPVCRVGRVTATFHVYVTYGIGAPAVEPPDGDCFSSAFCDQVECTAYLRSEDGLLRRAVMTDEAMLHEDEEAEGRHGEQYREVVQRIIDRARGG